MLATYSIKGGVGKTTTAVNLAYLGSREGLRTLIWDLDFQAATSFYFRVKPKVKGGHPCYISAALAPRTCRSARMARLYHADSHRLALPGRLANLALLGTLLLVAPLTAQRTDIVILKNGDSITGDIKQLDRAQLRLKTDHMGTVQIEWLEVEGLVSMSFFDVETTVGDRFYGTIGRGEEPGSIKVIGIEEVVLNHDDVIRITPIKQSFWARLDGAIDLGFNATRAHSALTLNFNGDVGFRTLRYDRRFTLSSWIDEREIDDRTIVDPESGETTQRSATSRHVADFAFVRFLGNKWQTETFGKLEQNDELGLDLRSTIGLGGGRYFLQTNRSDLLLAAGLSYSRERYFDERSSLDNTEGMLEFQYSFFTFGDRKTDISIRYAVHPSFTFSGRVRMQTDIKLSREIVKDFYLGITFYDSFDSDPPTVQTPTNDWQSSLNIGYSF